jgi:hypothetical protein
LADVASGAFIDGMHTALMVGSAALALGALVAALFLPARALVPETDADADTGGAGDTDDGTADRDLVGTTA